MTRLLIYKNEIKRQTSTYRLTDDHDVDLELVGFHVRVIPAGTTDAGRERKESFCESKEFDFVKDLHFGTRIKVGPIKVVSSGCEGRTKLGEQSGTQDWRMDGVRYATIARRAEGDVLTHL